jgi:hypothetical protein
MPPYNRKDMFHFSTQSVSIGTHLTGLKAAHKTRQRIGQRAVDEIFEAIRKAEFPRKPSLFTSLWVTDVFDPSIPRKAFNEDFELGWLYKVKPVGEICEIESHWAVLACRAITQSPLCSRELRLYIEDLAKKFWQPDIVPGPVRDFLCPQGAIVIKEVYVVTPADLMPDSSDERPS